MTKIVAQRVEEYIAGNPGCTPKEVLDGVTERSRDIQAMYGQRQPILRSMIRLLADGRVRMLDGGELVLG